ncbi:MAG: TrkA family potassium uptake protein [Candidatus Omnitrophica bacterium]|nr:TrkA family potassium uptake protein [Candidatus Omnitrophota bacterium]
MYILIAGGGNVGFYLAKRLISNKHTVALIEKDKEVCDEIAKEQNILVINGDACDPTFLEEAGIKRADVLAAVTGEDEDNLIICQLSKNIFDVSRTVARVNNSKNTRIFSELGIDVPVDGTSLIATVIEEEASFEDIVKLMTFKRGKLSIVRIDLTNESPVVGKQVMDMQIPKDSVLVSILRGGEVTIPKGDTVLKAGDDIIALTTIENERKLLDTLLGVVKG